MIIGEKNTDLKRLTGRLKLWQSGRLLRLGFNEIVQLLSKSKVLVALSVFSSLYFFHQ
jgi:hypothetical protein